MWRIAILFALAGTQLCWQPLRGQAPVRGVQAGSDQKQQPDLANGNTTPEQRGTKGAPLVVDIKGHKNTEEETAKEQREKDDKDFTDRWTFRATVAVAGFTGLLVIIGGLGVWAALRTLRAIEREFELSHRPWVSVALNIASPIVFDPDGMRVTIRFELRNTGNSPAIRTMIDVALDANWEQAQIDSNWKTCCDKPTIPIADYVSVTLFPGDPYPWDMEFTMPKETIEANRDPIEGRFVHLTVMGRVGYEFSFAKGQRTTPFIYEIVRSDGPRLPLEPPRVGRSELPGDAVHLVPHVTLFRQTRETQAT